jgi:antitoxin MazE
MRAALSKWGNSLAVRIPKALADSARLREGEAVELKSLRKGEILIRRRKSLEQLVDAITPENRHDATDWGPTVGKEIW